jgi:hypothetical protein
MLFARFFLFSSYQIKVFHCREVCAQLGVEIGELREPQMLLIAEDEKGTAKLQLIDKFEADVEKEETSKCITNFIVSLFSLCSSFFVPNVHCSHRK